MGVRRVQVINRVHQRVAEDLAEERTQRCKELQEFKREVAALEEVHREVERGTQSQFQQEIQVGLAGDSHNTWACRLCT